MSSVVLLRFTSVTDRRTDRQTNTSPQHIPRYANALRGHKTDTYPIARCSLRSRNGDLRISARFFFYELFRFKFATL